MDPISVVKQVCTDENGYGKTATDSSVDTIIVRDHESIAMDEIKISSDVTSTFDPPSKTISSNDKKVDAYEVERKLLSAILHSSIDIKNEEIADTKDLSANGSGNKDEIDDCTQFENNYHNSVDKIENDCKDDFIITGLSEEVLKLNPDFAAFNEFGYGLRKRGKTALTIKNEPSMRQPKPRDHRKRNHIIHYSYDDNNGLQCVYCSKSVPTSKGLWNHMRIHNVNNMQDLKKVIVNPNQINFKCALCKKIFDSNEELLSHKKETHSACDPFMCKKCKVAFSDHYDYLSHKIKHNKNSTYPCDECPKILNTKTGYQIHIGTHFEKKYPCDICKKLFVNEFSLKNHKNSVHNFDPNNMKSCPECGKKFKEKKALDYHMFSHTGVRPFQCLYCGIGFFTRQARKNHTRRHTDERPFECEICHKTFRQSGDLVHHKLTHTDREKKYECEYCEKKFLLETSLKQHRRRHTMTDLLKCGQCDHTSTNKSNLRTHIIHMHMEDKLHKCDICNMDFKMRHDLTRHLKSLKHRNKTYGASKKQN